MSLYNLVPEKDLTLPVTFSGEDSKRITFNQNLQSLAIQSTVPLKMSVSFYNPLAIIPDDPGNLIITLPTSPQIRPHFGNSDREIIRQRVLFNRIYLKASAPFSGIVYLFFGAGADNLLTEEII